MSDSQVSESNAMHKTVDPDVPALTISAMAVHTEQFSSALRASLLSLTTGSKVEQEAIGWLIVMEYTECVESHWDDFQTWLGQRKLHKHTYLRIERMWHETAALVAEHLRQVELQDSGFWKSRFDASKLRRGLQWTTPCALAVAVVYIILHELVAPPMGETEVETEFGKQQTVVLPDHSIVTLNTDSRLHARLSWSERDLVLERGEGVFHVQKEKRPFSVETKGAVVRATGTDFSVRQQPDSDVISVSDGHVEVAPRTTPSAAALAQHESKPKTINAGDVAVVNPQGAISVDHPGVPMVQRGMLWQHDQIALTSAPLDEWVSEFNRYNRRTLVIRDASISKHLITGIFSAREPDKFADALSDTDIQHTSSGTPGSDGGTIDLWVKK